MSVFDTDARKHSVTTLLQIAVFVVTVITFFTSFVQPIHATDAECSALTIEGLPSSCQPYLDNAGQVIPAAQYYKCTDTINCDPVDPALPASETNPILTRCCVEPFEGSYGGACFSPDKIDRSDLGANLNTGLNFNFKPKNCDGIDEDMLSIRNKSGDKNVYVVPPKLVGGVNVPQKLSSAFEKMPGIIPDKKPEEGRSVGFLPIQEEIVVIEEHATFADNKPKYKSYAFYFEEDDGVVRNDDGTPVTNAAGDVQIDPTQIGVRRYFVSRNQIWKVNDKRINGVEIRRGPFDPRKVGNQPGDKPLDKPLRDLGCRIGNVFMTPLSKVMNSLEGMLTSRDNLPDISLLCVRGTPEFKDPTLLEFDDDGNMTGLDAPGNCHCVDTNSGPATASVLMCTRYIAGIADIHAPWRVLVPAPNSAGDGSRRFLGLLFGAPTESGESIDEFRRRVKADIDGFFDTPDEVRTYVEEMKTGGNQTLSPELFLLRFFGVRRAEDIDTSPAGIETFKQNNYARQFIGCLACANYGGFNSALGCMPMNSVERFLAEGVLGFGITLAAAASIFCIIYGAIQFQLSAGESAKVQKAQKLITQCIVGLLIILFSVFILRFVGVNLLRIYGLG